MPSTPEDPRLLLLVNGTLRLHPLPILLFPSGHAAFVQRLPWRCAREAGGWGWEGQQKCQRGQQHSGAAACDPGTVPTRRQASLLATCGPLPSRRRLLFHWCRHGVEPYVVHATFQRFPTPQQRPGKRSRFRYEAESGGGVVCRSQQPAASCHSQSSRLAVPQL